jgi:hypothetical protein
MTAPWVAAPMPCSVRPAFVWSIPSLPEYDVPVACVPVHDDAAASPRAAPIDPESVIPL